MGCTLKGGKPNCCGKLQISEMRSSFEMMTRPFEKKLIKSLEIKKIITTFVVPSLTNREFSSAGSEHLPYKQRVGGSNPSTPTTISYLNFQVAFLFYIGFVSRVYCSRCRASNCCRCVALQCLLSQASLPRNHFKTSACGIALHLLCNLATNG